MSPPSPHAEHDRLVASAFLRERHGWEIEKTTKSPTYPWRVRRPTAKAFRGTYGPNLIIWARQLGWQYPKRETPPPVE